MKKAKIIYWVTTGVLFINQGLMPIFTTNANETKVAMTYLGYPAYFVLILAIFKLLGGIALIIPQIPARVKEWAYAGFAIDFIAATISLAVVGGLNGTLLIPTIALTILIFSYWSYHKMNQKKLTYFTIIKN